MCFAQRCPPKVSVGRREDSSALIVKLMDAADFNSNNKGGISQMRGQQSD